jgi:hypothetical protein
MNSRRRIRALASILAGFTIAPLAFVQGTASAEPPPAATPAPTPAPTVATAEQAATALAKFKEDYKAKGLKGDDKLAQKDFALAALAKLQHATIVDALAQVSRETDSTLRMLGVIYLADQTALPGLAGAKVVAATKAAGNDAALLMTCLQSVGKLQFLGARPEIHDALKSQSFAVKKAALTAVAKTADVRLLPDVLEVIGLKLPTEGAAGSGADSKDSSGGKEVTEGYSWEGASASVDTGASGNADQAAAEAQAKAQAAANAAAANGGAGGGSSSGPGGGGSDGGQGGRGGGGRSTNELLPQVLGVLQKLTGKTFTGPSDFKKWYVENRLVLADKMKSLDEKEKAQKAAATVK